MTYCQFIYLHLLKTKRINGSPINDLGNVVDKRGFYLKIMGGAVGDIRL